MSPIASGDTLVARARRGPSAQRVLLGCALVWGVLLVVVSATAPIYTVPTSQGAYQPRETVLAAYGVPGLLPAVALLIIGAVVAALLWRRQHGATTTARVLAIVVFVASYASLLVLHIWSLLVVPFGALLVAAAFVPQPRDRRQ